MHLSNHLGNVLVTVSDRKLAESTEGSTASGSRAEVLFASDYYPFGMQMPGREFSAEEYRYGFQGQETDKEWLGGAVSYKYRVHDARIGRFLSVDPLAPDYPWNSPYAFSENRVIDSFELEGLESIDFRFTTNYGYDGTVIENTISIMDNVSGHIMNAPIDLADGLISDFGFMFTHSLSENVEQTGRAARSIGNGIVNSIENTWGYHTKTPISDQLSDLGNLESWEKPIANVLSLALGGVASLEQKALTFSKPLSNNQRNLGLTGGGASFAVKSFDDLAANPLSIWGKSADEVGEILGEGWKKYKLDSGEGWKFLETGRDGFVSFTTGNSHHPNSTYYKINGGTAGKNKVVGKDYVPTPDDKSNIFYTE
jgi:RHS repeat-associated protein